MQNNVTEITQKLLGALDGDYNVTNMATIIEVITLLEKVTITKELLEATRLGKHINELRKHLANDTLAKRVKLLVKKWRNIVLVANPPDVSALPVPVATNGQIRPSAAPLDEGGGKKRPPSRLDHTPTHVKKHRANGGGTAPPFDYDFSDNSNSSFKDIVSSTPAKQPVTLVVVNSDSNSSTSAQDALLRESAYDDQIPKKRGRKKGSKNHKNLIEEAESSFSNKMAVSRGNAKVKTTQELIESLQNRSLPPAGATPTSPARNVDDWRERAAKLTERVSLIDQKLNSGVNRLKKHRSGSNNNRESGVLHHSSPLQHLQRPASPDDEDDDEIIVVDDVPAAMSKQHRKRLPSDDNDAVDSQPPTEQHLVVPLSLSEEEALRRLPPIDMDGGEDEHETPVCWCVMKEPVESSLVVDGSAEERPPLPPPPVAFREHVDCPARRRLEEKYRLNDVGDERVALLHAAYADNLNGNYGEARLQCEQQQQQPSSPTTATSTPSTISHTDVNIVPNFYQLPAKSEACSETYKKYSISEGGEERGPGPGQDSTKGRQFCEFHECLDRPSYDGETLRILPYVIID